MASPLLQFLAQARSAVLRPPTSTPPPSLTLVLGNPSCDLDSFICATLYAFVHSKYLGNAQSPRLHVPILNLPSTSSTDLWRLRPEFGTALRLALNGKERDEKNGAEIADKRLLENLLTISDIRSTDSSPLHHLFSKPTNTASSERTPVILVDHNALSIPSPDIQPSKIYSNLSIVGCIDHHSDESSVPITASPRIIKTGIGSCTSLVVQYLRDECFWEDLLLPSVESNEDGPTAAVELAVLSLASILIDTADLTAEGKVSDTDREAVSFLEDIVHIVTANGKSTITRKGHFDRSAFCEQISSSKANSLSFLTLPEIFDRDYKAWSEKTESSRTTLNLGIASVVKCISWLIDKADSSSAEELVTVMRDFASGQRPALDLFAIMTTSASQRGGFQRELLVLRTGNSKKSYTAMEKFEEKGKAELGLNEWREDEKFVNLLKPEDGKIWWQRNVSKSRKQVAPLLREAMRSA